MEEPQTLPTCCGKPMKRLKDTKTERNRYQCTLCKATMSQDILQNADIAIKLLEEPKISAWFDSKLLGVLDASYVAGLKYSNKRLLQTEDDKLPTQEKNRKHAILRILKYWENRKVNDDENED